MYYIKRVRLKDGKSKYQFFNRHKNNLTIISESSLKKENNVITEQKIKIIKKLKMKFV